MALLSNDSDAIVRGRRRIALALAAALVALTLGALCTPALALDGEDPLDEVPQKTETLKIDVDRPFGEAAALGLGSGTATLAPGRHEYWIDRFTMPKCGRDLYYLMDEGSDNDGRNDFLIDDRAFRPASGDSALRDYVPGNIVTYDDETYVVIGQIGYDDSISDYYGVAYPAYGSFVCDHPEVFWLGNQLWVTGMRFGGAGANFLLVCLSDRDQGYDMREDLYRSASSIRSDIAVRDNRVSQLLRETKGMDVYDRLGHFNDWLTEHNDYNIDVNLYDDTPYHLAYRSITALKGQTGSTGPVCDSYARAMKTLCDAAEIPCVYVCSNDHAWNYVQVRGRWYAIDVTWNDPTADYARPPKSGRETRNYFLVGSETVVERGETFASGHPVQNDVWNDRYPYAKNGPELSRSACPRTGREVVPVYRLLNPYTGEHLFTTRRSENADLPSLGWLREEIAWYGVAGTGTPVYRLSNPYNGDHHYTLDRNEYASLGRAGWRQEGVCWYAEDGGGIPVHRLYNPYNMGAGAHHLTTDYDEAVTMMRSGWRYEKVAFYGAGV